MGAQFTDALYKGGLVVKEKWVTGEKLKGAMERAKAAYIPKTGKFKTTLSDSDLAVFNRVKDVYRVTGGKIENIGLVKEWGVTEKGIKVPQVTFLYAGLPPDKIVKSIVEAGRVTADMVRGLDAVKASQVTQQLLSINPALANEFLKAVEKPVAVPEAKEEVPPVKPEIKEEIPKVEPKVPKILYHGTSAKFKEFEGVTYLTDTAEEAAEFGKQTLRVEVDFKKTKDIDEVVADAIEEGEDVDKLIEGELEIARGEGYDSLYFRHPSG
ncbi:unnamed protein product, partial [marine sediment metagenome]